MRGDEDAVIYDSVRTRDNITVLNITALTTSVPSQSTLSPVPS
jgi:hypothetical protein